MLSYAHGTSLTPLLGQTIGENLRKTVEQHGDKEAFVSRHQRARLTYHEFWNWTTRVAKALLRRGVQKGDRVGIWSPNRIEWPIVQYATARIGAILVNVNPSYRASELEFALRQSGVGTLVYAPSFRTTDYEAMLLVARPNCRDLRDCIRFDHQWNEFLADADGVNDADLADRESSLNCDDPINIQYTSGTTGRPKGATLTHHNILNNGFFVGEGLRYSEHDRICVPVPFYHCFGMVLGCLASTSHGSCLVIPSESFDPRQTLDAITAERCTSLYGVPTMFLALLEHPDFNRCDVSHLRTGVMAGAPCPVELMRNVIGRLHMPEVAIGYGMTEMSPIATFTAADDSLEKRVGTVGRVFPHFEGKIIDPQSGATVARGTQGEFCARGYGIMRGYWDDPTATDASIDSGGWMHSGDSAVMDPDGYVRIVGRIKDLIIRGGENVAPREVEELLATHPAVSDAQVIGVPNERYGEEIMAWVRLKSGASATADELRSYCAHHLAPFKVPRLWRFVTEYPLTVTGKIQKFRLREIAAQEGYR